MNNNEYIDCIDYNVDIYFVLYVTIFLVLISKTIPVKFYLINIYFNDIKSNKWKY